MKHNSALLRLKAGISVRTLFAAIVLAVSVAALHARNPAPASSSDATTIVHVTVIDVATGNELPDQTVVLQGDRIASVAAFDTNAATPQGRVLYAHGIGITTRLVALTHVNRVTPALSPENEAQTLGHTDKIFCRGGRLFWRHAGISIGLMKMFSVGTGRPSSIRLST